MPGRIGKYVLAAGITAAVASVFGPFRCTLYGCVGGFSPQTLLTALAVGATIGVVGMAVIDIAISARYRMINRSLAKQQREAKPPQSAD
jgi:hypothetical protein